MGAYRVAHNYHAVYRSTGLGFDEGASVDVDDEVAAWVNRDSPGTLVPADAPDPEPTDETVDDTETEAPEETKPKRGRRASA